MKTQRRLMATLFFATFVMATAFTQGLMKDFIGTNMQAKGNAASYTQFDFVREFHTWGSNIGDAPTPVIRSPQNPYQFNPSYDHSTFLNNDDFYGQMAGKISPSLMGIAAEMRGITHYLGACDWHHTEKPIYFGGLENIIDPYTDDNPETDDCTTFANDQFIPWVSDFYDANIVPTGICDLEQINNNNFSITFKRTNVNKKEVTIFVRVDWNHDKDFLDADEDIITIHTPDIDVDQRFHADPQDINLFTINLSITTNVSNIIANANSGLHAMRIVVKEGAQLFPSGWFDGDLVDLPSYSCSGAYFSVASVDEYTFNSMDDSGYFHLTDITLPGIHYHPNNTKGYENLLTNLNYLTLSPTTDYPFILENSQIGNTNWSIELDDIPCSVTWTGNHHAYKVKGKFSASNASAGIHQLRISAGSNQTAIWVINKGPNCSVFNNYNIDQPNVPLKQFLINPLVDQEDPNTYYDYALYNTLFAAKYGVSGSHYGDMKGLVDDNEHSRNAVPSVTHIEIGNEEDAYWWEENYTQNTPGGGANNVNTPNAQIQMLPEMYGAMLSAAYDGGCGTMTWTDGQNNVNLGIHSVAPEVKVIPAGLTGLRGSYVINMIKYFEKTRTNNNYPTLPFDAINFHHYLTEPNASSVLENFNKMFDEYDHDPNLPNSLSVSPEEGKLRWMVEETIHRILTSPDISNDVKSELQQKEIWFSEFGYGTTGVLQGAWGGVPIIGNDGSRQRTQAQWIVRSYLELAAVESEGMKVNKAMVFDVEDKLTGGSDLFDNYGLTKDKVNNYAPKKSWYHVQTMRNVLGETEYVGEFSGHILNDLPNASPLKEARIHHYKGDYKGHPNVDILVIWSPNSIGLESDLVLNDLQTMVESGSSINSLTLITPRDGDEDGYHKSYSGLNNSFTFDNDTKRISETPMYVVLGVEEDEVEKPCDAISIRDISCNSMTVNWSGWGQGSANIYIQEGNVQNLDIANSEIRLMGNSIQGSRYNIGNLRPNTTYTVFVVNYNKNTGARQICTASEKTNEEICRLEMGTDFTITEDDPVNDDAEQAFDYSGMDCNSFWDTDLDGFIDGLDYDKDGDAIPDLFDVDGDGVHAPFDFEINGVQFSVEDADDDGVVNWADSYNGDRYPPLDLPPPDGDADRNGIYDKYENDSDKDGKVDFVDIDYSENSGANDDNGNGIVDDYDADYSTFPDSDGDKIIDVIDNNDANRNNLVDSWENTSVQWDWDGTENLYRNPTIIVDFQNKVKLKSISFLHVKGNGTLSIQYKRCNYPMCKPGCNSLESDWITYGDITPDGYMNWVHLGQFTSHYITKLRITRNQRDGVNVGNGIVISRLSFCGDISEEPCEDCTSQVFASLSPATIDNVVLLKQSGHGGNSISFDPVLITKSDHLLGYNDNYEIFYQEDDGTNDFTNSTYRKGYLFDGLDRVKIPLTELEAEKEYKLYLRTLPKYQCTSDTKPATDVVLPPKFENPDEVAADTIIYFSTMTGGDLPVSERSGNNNGNDKVTTQKQSVHVKPNPTSGFITVEWDTSGYSTLLITDPYTGAVIRKANIDINSLSHQMDLGTLQPAVYQIQLLGRSIKPIYGQFVKAAK